MRVHALGIKRIAGPRGKESGKPFDFTQLIIQTPVEMTANENVRVVGYGYETMTLDVQNESLSKFSGFHFPCDLDLVVDSVAGRRGLRSIIVDAKAVTLKAAS